MSHLKVIFFINLLVLILIACNQNVIYDKNLKIEDETWSRNDTLKYKFKIPDYTLSYDLFLKIRYSTDYMFYNMYTKVILSDSLNNKKLDTLIEMNLFDEKRGIPLGNGSTGIYDLQVPILINDLFTKPELYNLSVKHYMREKIIEGIYDVGIMVKKSENDRE